MSYRDIGVLLGGAGKQRGDRQTQVHACVHTHASTLRSGSVITQEKEGVMVCSSSISSLIQRLVNIGRLKPGDLN